MRHSSLEEVNVVNANAWKGGKESLYSNSISIVREKEEGALKGKRRKTNCEKGLDAVTLQTKVKGGKTNLLVWCFSKPNGPLEIVL